MPLLNAQEIKNLLNPTTGAIPLAQNEIMQNGNWPDSAIQACSLDLTVGSIYLPGSKEGELGSAEAPRTFYNLNQGSTAIIKTSERINLPDEIGAIAFPPARVSLQGLLMTNPGHVDPGYSGNLHLTIINMGSEPYKISRGDRIARILFFNLNAPTNRPFGYGSVTGAKNASVFKNTRSRLLLEHFKALFRDMRDFKQSQSIKAPGPITNELLHILSPDFLNIQNRVKNAVSQSELSIKWATPIITGVCTIVAAMVLYVVQKNNNDAYEKTQNEFNNRITLEIKEMKSGYDGSSIVDRVKLLEEELKNSERHKNLSREH